MSARHPVLQELLRAVPPPRTQTPRARAPGRKRRPATAKAKTKPKTKQRATRRETRKCTYALPGELAQEFRVLCAVQEVTQREVIEQLVREFVGRHERLLRD